MTRSASLALGLDVGSTTVKAVLLDARAPEAPVRSAYARHRGEPEVHARRLLAELWPRRRACALALTGSSAPRLAAGLGAAQVHEVVALEAAVRARHPAARAAFELGGQDAKALFLGPNPLLTMNDRCAAGTGVTLDRCLLRLGLSPERAAALAHDRRVLRPVSTKCGVFAETDVAQHARAGVPADELFVSVLDAVAAGCLAALARGRAPAPTVLLLGGPCAHYPALASAFRAQLAALWRGAGVAFDALDQAVFVPPHALYFAALGAALAAPELEPSDARTREQARGALARLPRERAAREDEPLARSEVEAAAALQVVARARAPWPETPLGVDGYVAGVDAGSTRSKLAVLDAQGRLCAAAELPSGAPEATARALLDAALARLPAGARLEAVGVTGYGAPLLAALLHADVALVETAAHALSARAVAPDVDLVCDLGGQDLKVLALEPDGALGAFHLTTQCSAGVGMALEAFARELAVPLDGLSALALAARRAPYFGETCTVFLDANRVSFQRLGYDRGELLAGLVRAVPRMLWTQAGSVDPHRAGAVLLQGGVQHFDAAVFAQLEHLRQRAPRARVLVHPHPSLAGALGAALAAARHRGGRGARARRSLVTPAVTRTTTSACELCANRCDRTVFHTDLPGAPPLLAGYGCEAGATLEGAPSALRRRRVRGAVDLYDLEARALFAPPRVAAQASSVGGPRLRLGIPRVLGMYRAAPLLSAYLQRLGVARRDLVFSPPTGPALLREGAGFVATDPCFPVKLVVPHALHLLRSARRSGRPLDALLVPRFTRARTAARGCRDCASCPVVVAAPSLLRAALYDGERRDEAAGVALLDPELDLSDPERCAAQLHACFGPLLGASRERSDEAYALARGAALRFERGLQERGRVVLDGASAARGRGAVLLLARPYHADPGVSHAVGAALGALGYPTLGLRAIPSDEAYLTGLFRAGALTGQDPFELASLLSETDNSGAAERLWAARVAVAHGGLGVLDLSSFKCGQDAPTFGVTQALLRDAGVVTASLHELDETRPRAGLRVRLETFTRALRERGLGPWS